MNFGSKSRKPVETGLSWLVMIHVAMKEKGSCLFGALITI